MNPNETKFDEKEAAQRFRALTRTVEAMSASIDEILEDEGTKAATPAKPERMPDGTSGGRPLFAGHGATGSASRSCASTTCATRRRRSGWRPG